MGCPMRLRPSFLDSGFRRSDEWRVALHRHSGERRDFKAVHHFTFGANIVKYASYRIRRT